MQHVQQPSQGKRVEWTVRELAEDHEDEVTWLHLMCECMMKGGKR